jgi:hypothetical protein
VLLQVVSLYVGVGPTYLIVKKVIGFVFHTLIKNVGPFTLCHIIFCHYIVKVERGKTSISNGESEHFFKSEENRACDIMF